MSTATVAVTKQRILDRISVMRAKLSATDPCNHAAFIRTLTELADLADKLKLELATPEEAQTT